jgi:hypothetical protein
LCVTLVKVLADWKTFAECETIFTMLIGEDVEVRRKLCAGGERIWIFELSFAGMLILYTSPVSM